MAKKTTHRRSSPPAAEARPAVTLDRFNRLYRLLHLLADRARKREWLTRQLRLDVRGFYRDLVFLRGVGIVVALDEDGYRLSEPVDKVVLRLPFPDPHLTLGEVHQLARGNAAVHRRLKAQLAGLPT
jgi:hypothetical protein